MFNCIAWSYWYQLPLVWMGGVIDIQYWKGQGIHNQTWGFPQLLNRRNKDVHIFPNKHFKKEALDPFCYQWRQRHDIILIMKNKCIRMFCNDHFIIPYQIQCICKLNWILWLFVPPPLCYLLLFIWKSSRKFSSIFIQKNLIIIYS